jgi:hypothetical protein
MKPLREFALEFASNFLKNGAPFPLSDDYIYHCARLVRVALRVFRLLLANAIRAQRNFAQANFGLLCADAPAMPSPDITVKTEDAPPCSMDSPSTSGTRVGERADTAADPTAASTSSELDLDATFWKHYGQDIRQLSASCPSQEAYVTSVCCRARRRCACSSPGLGGWRRSCARTSRATVPRPHACAKAVGSMYVPRAGIFLISGVPANTGSAVIVSSAMRSGGRVFCDRAWTFVTNWPWP